VLRNSLLSLVSSFASGVMGGLTAAGAVLGLVTIGFFLPISSAYPLYAASIIVTTPLTWLAARETPLEEAVGRYRISCIHSLFLPVRSVLKRDLSGGGAC
jgi:hypothetical protein